MEERSLQVVDAKVIEQLPSGGGVVEVPVLGVTPEIALDKTAGGGKGTASITLEDLNEMAANFGRWPGPVPIGVSPHVDFEDRSGASPGFVDSLSVRGDRLWARLSLIPALFAQFVEGMWRGFSVELSKDSDMPTGMVPGWAVTGGIFTNRPATDVDFRASFGSVAECGTVQLSLRQPSRMEEKEMADETKTVSMEFHESEIGKVKVEAEAKTKSIATLESRLEKRGAELSDARRLLAEAETTAHTALEDKQTAEGRANRFEVENKRLATAKAQLETSLNETAAGLADERKVNLSMKVRDIVTNAIDAGAPPALFDGFESDPAAWMESKYASLESFEDVAKSFSAVGSPTGAQAKSGHDPSKEAEPETVSAEVKAELAKRNRGTEFVGVTTEAEAKAAFEASKKDKE